MIPLKICWLVLEGLLTVFFLRFGSSEALGLAILLVLLPLGSLPVNLYVGKRLRFSFGGSINLRKKETGEVVLKILNPTGLPVLRLSCMVCTENQLNGQSSKLRIHSWIPGKTEQSVTFHTGSDYCGRLRISAPRVKLYDCFGLIGISCKTDAVYHVTVQPDTFEPDIALLPYANSIDESDVYAQDRPGSDLTETFQIREYTPGDSPRQVHWKLSGKFDRLIVRDPALPITRNVLLFWERTGQSGDPAILDAQAEVMVSLGKALLERSEQFTVGWNDTDRNLCILHEIQSMDDLVGVIPRLLRATGAKKGISGAELLLQTGSHALCAHMVYLAEQPQPGVLEMERYGHVTKLLCGKERLTDGICFDAQNYIQQLSHIDL